MGGAEATQPAYEGWAIVELMGHRQTAGEVREVTLAGSSMLRIDTPGANGETVATQIYGGSAIYCVTPCDEATARKALEEAYSLPPPVRLALRPALRPEETAALPAPGGTGSDDLHPDDLDMGDRDDPDDENPF